MSTHADGVHSSPSPAQLALALAIVKLKPATLGIREYILQSRKSISVTETAEIFHTPDKFFDSISFWKQAYEKSEAEQSQLLDRNFELEQRNAILMAKVHPREEIPAEVIVQKPLKRRATRSQTTNKRAKTQLYSKENASVVAVEAFRDDTMDQLDSLRTATGPFMRQSYLLQRALQKRPNDPSIIQTAIILYKTCVDELVGVVPQETSKNKSKNELLTQPQLSHLSLVLRGIESAVGLLLQALWKLSRSKDSVQETRLLTYYIVCLYEAIMNTLRRYCCKTAPARVVPVRTEYTIQTRKKTSKRTKANADPDTQFKFEDEGAIQLISLLNKMITSLDLIRLEHQQLLEGFLYILLSHAGQDLCLFVFQDLQLRPDLRMDTLKLPLPAGLLNFEVDGKSLGAAEMESRYLVWLLRRALAVLDIHSSSTDSLPSEDKPDRAQFISSIKARLQSTLVQAVFGAEPEFGRTLERPAQPEGHDLESFLKDHQSPELSPSEWYIQEIWQLLGWEVLTKNNLS
ncbi:hypothetical protein BDW62DRAFT_198765 [Aspergillus aurantiobrunneus]